MGKKRVSELLNQLKDNQQRDIQNAASIFTVAQVAVDTLEQQTIPENTTGSEHHQLLLEPSSPLNKAELLRRYGSYRGCRKAAKEQGIKFRKTPSWQHLVIGFQRAEDIQVLMAQYLDTSPMSQANEISITINLSKLGTLKLSPSGIASKTSEDID